MPDAARVHETVRLIVERGIGGIVWLDRDLKPFLRLGHIVDDFEPGLPVTSHVPVFIGLDDEFRRLETAGPAEQLLIPNVLSETGPRPRQKYNLEVMWVASQRCFLVYKYKAGSPQDIEYRLSAEIRARLMAEAEAAAQAHIVRRMNQELALANLDLEEFASAISHDLRAPLRGLRYAAADARHDLATGDIESASRQLDRTLTLARRMSAMLTGLLDYARAGRKTDNLESIDTSALVREVIDSVAVGATQRITVRGDWPTLVTLAEPLDIVIRNLLDNAVKHHDRSDGEIVVTGQLTADDLVVTVADDGPGIDPAWHKAVFLPFKQVADAEDAGGAGIGLALVKKTVERFGGSITIASDPRQRRGTEFRVLWPRAIPT